MAVKWYGDEVLLQLKEATAEMLDAAAHLIETEAKINAAVDTGFMRNSIYVVTPISNTYGKTDASGSFQSKKEKRQVERRLAPQANAPEDGAVVVVGAEYAIYEEMHRAFLYPALEKVASSKGAEIVSAGKKVIGE